MTNNPKSRQSNLVVQEMEAELLIYDLQTNKAFCLNQTSAMVWQFCDGTNSIAEIAEAMSRKLKMQVSEEFVWLALGSLERDDLLENADEIAINFNGLNRREVIRKVGLASLVTLPIIASVIAPSALMAQSGNCASGVVCNGDCCTPGSACLSGACCPAGTLVCENTCCPSPGVCVNFSINGIPGQSCCSSGITCFTVGVNVTTCCSPGQTCMFGGCG